MQSGPSSASQKLSGGPYVCLSSHCEALNLIGDQVHPYACISSQTILGRAVSSARFTTPLPAFIYEALFTPEGGNNKKDPNQLEEGANKTGGMMSDLNHTKIHPHTDSSKVIKTSTHPETLNDYVERPFMSTETVDLSGYSLFPTPPPTQTNFSEDLRTILLAFEQDFGIPPYWSAHHFSNKKIQPEEKNLLHNRMEDNTFTPSNINPTHLNPASAKSPPSTLVSNFTSNKINKEQGLDSETSDPLFNISNNNGQLILHTLAQALLILQLPGRSPVASFQIHQYRPCYIYSEKSSSLLNRNAFYHDIHFSIRPRNNTGNTTTTNSIVNFSDHHFVFNTGMEVRTNGIEKNVDGSSVDFSATSERKRVKTEAKGSVEGCKNTLFCKGEPFISLRCINAFPTSLNGGCWFAGISAPQAENIFKHTANFFGKQQKSSQNSSQEKLRAAMNLEFIITDTLIPLFFPMCLKSYESPIDIPLSQEGKSDFTSSHSATSMDPKHRVSFAQKLSFEFLRCLVHLSWCMDVVKVVERASHSKNDRCDVQGMVLFILPDTINVEQAGEPWCSILFLVKPKRNKMIKSSGVTPEKGNSSARPYDFSGVSEKEGLIEYSLEEIPCLLGSVKKCLTGFTALDDGGIDGIVIRATGCGGESGQLEWKAFGDPFNAKKMKKGGVLTGKLKDFCQFIEES
ncbi:unnamed protein product [Phytomonas sp. Hart1]|nr:unnamed protein product [Phytomonas sp. Hart1]|eukprot:CCW66607.1 unnamed protein product [Phytomonas sp. isolate Hart1]